MNTEIDINFLKGWNSSYTGLFKMTVEVLTTCQFGTNSIIVLMFVESQRVHIEHL